MRTFLGAFGLALSLAACGEREPEMTLLDAASLFRAHGTDLGAIEQAYPGPYLGFFRVPARLDEDQKPGDETLMKTVRAHFPVEFIDFFPLGDTGKDEVNVILKRFSGEYGWTIISLVYSEIPLPEPEGEENKGMAMYDSCDSRAVQWISRKPTSGSYSVFCRLSDKWYAFQSVH